MAHQQPCNILAPLFTFECSQTHSTEAKDDDDGMSMLVDLAGAAAAAGTAAPAAGNGNGGTAEEGARVKVTYSYFAVRVLRFFWHHYVQVRL